MFEFHGINIATYWTTYFNFREWLLTHEKNKCRYEARAICVKNAEINLKGNVSLLHEQFAVVNFMRNHAWEFGGAVCAKDPKLSLVRKKKSSCSVELWPWMVVIKKKCPPLWWCCLDDYHDWIMWALLGNANWMKVHQLANVRLVKKLLLFFAPVFILCIPV